MARTAHLGRKCKARVGFIPATGSPAEWQVALNCPGGQKKMTGMKIIKCMCDMKHEGDGSKSGEGGRAGEGRGCVTYMS
jgi:hypothetical protein